MGVADSRSSGSDFGNSDPAAVAADRPSADGNRRAAMGLVVVLGALSAFGPLCLDMYLPSLPELAPALGSTDAAAQLSLSACILGLALGQLVVGPISDRVGRRGPLLVGVAVFALVSAACAVTTSMPLLIVLRFVQGAAGAAGIVVGRAVVADRYSGKAAASYFAAMAAVNGFAPILSPIIGGQVLRVGTWRTIFWVLAAIGVVLFVATYVVVSESLAVDRRSRGGVSTTARAFAMVLGDRVYLGYTFAGCLVAAAMFGYISGSPFMLQEGFGLSAQWFSVCFAANATGIIAATWIGRLLLRRMGSAAILNIGLAQCGAGAAVLSVAVFARLGLWPVLIGFFVMVSAVGFALPHSSALAMDRHRAVAGAASALFGLIQFALAAIAAPLVGIGDRVVGTAVAVCAVGCAVLAGAALAMARVGRASEKPGRARNAPRRKPAAGSRRRP